MSLSVSGERRFEHELSNIVVPFEFRLSIDQIFLFEIRSHVGHLDVGQLRVQIGNLHLETATSTMTLRLPDNTGLGRGGLISHFCSPQPDTSEFPGWDLVNRGNVSLAAAAQSCHSILPICEEIWLGCVDRGQVFGVVAHWQRAGFATGQSLVSNSTASFT